MSHQLKLIKMRAKLSNLNPCAVPFFSRAANLCWLVLYYRFCCARHCIITFSVEIEHWLLRLEGKMFASFLSPIQLCAEEHNI